MELKTHVILLILQITRSEGRFYVSNTSSVSPGKDCVLAQPRLRYNGKILTIQETSEVNDVFNDDDTFWIGYFQALAGFEYIGCGSKTDTRLNMNISKQSDALEDPGSCFYFCKSYFGISQTSCHCLDGENLESNLFTESMCKECDDAKGVACGNSSHVSIYKINYKVVDQNENNRCALLEPYEKCLQWESCTKSGYPAICYNQKSSYKIPNVEKWIGAAQSCFGNGSRPATFNESKQIDIHNGTQLWTGLMSSLAIFHFNDTKTVTAKFGVLRKKNGTFTLEFPNNFHHERKSLCVEADTSPPRSTTESSLQSKLSEIPTSTSPNTTANTVTNRPISSTNIIITTEIDKHSDVKQSSGVGIPLGVSVAVVLIIVVAVAVVVVIKKRKLRPPTNNSSEITKNAMREEGTNDYIEIPETKHPNGNSQLCNLKTEEQDNYAHTYHALEKNQTKKGKINIKSDTGPQTESHYNYPDMTDFLQGKVNGHPTDIDNGQYAHTYFVLEEHPKVMDFDDGTYNVTRAHKTKTVQETDNVYNRLDDKNDDNYDHMPGSASKKKDSDNVYNSKENATSVLKPGEEPDSVYNQDSNVGECDTYDHVNNKVFEPNEAGDVYGV